MINNVPVSHSLLLYKISKQWDQIVNLLSLRIIFLLRVCLCSGKSCSAHLSPTGFKLSTYSNVFQAGANTGSNMTSNCLLVWKNSSKSVCSFQWSLFDFLCFLQQGLESFQDQAPLAIPFSSGLCSSQRSRKPAVKRLWKVHLQWRISWYEDMFSYLISYYCENWKWNTHFLPSLGKYDFIGLNPRKVKCFMWR